jgi:hypothetical protein
MKTLPAECMYVVKHINYLTSTAQHHCRMPPHPQLVLALLALLLLLLLLLPIALLHHQALLQPLPHPLYCKR